MILTTHDGVREWVTERVAQRSAQYYRNFLTFEQYQYHVGRILALGAAMTRRIEMSRNAG